MTGREHSVHDFRREICRALDGSARVVFGCTHGNEWAGCSATEVRRVGEPSPSKVARAKRRMAARERRWKGEVVRG